MRPILLARAVLMAVGWTAQCVLAIDASLVGEASNALSAFLADAPLSTQSASASTQALDMASLRSAVIAGNYTSRLSNLTRQRCPVSCTSAGAVDSSNWSVYHSVDRLSLCNSTMLLDFAVFNLLGNSDTHISISACTADLDSSTTETVASIASDVTSNTDGANLTEVTSSVQLSSSGSTSEASLTDVVAALEQLQISSALNVAQLASNETFHFSLSGNAAVGVYVGSGLASQQVITSILKSLISQVQSDGTVAETLLVQLCDNRTARYSLGVFIDTQANLSSVQSAVQSWRNNTCITTMDKITEDWKEATFLATSHIQLNSSVSNSSVNITNSTTLAKRSHGRVILPRDDTCTTAQVVSGDTCITLAAECGITYADFTDYNSIDDCTDLPVGEYVCCSSGTLPDNSPQPDSDDNCYAYVVVTGDTCSALAATYYITVDEIESYNNDTWGWMGCGDLLIGNNMCLSSGWPPMPTTIDNAVCGPQVNGTATAPHGTDLSTLNECPLNACCDIWGQCGTTAEFCTISNSTTGAPGTAAANENGCISNCGTDIVTSDAPAEYFSIAYFEGFDWERPCLRMSVDQVDTSSYTHIHFGFAAINADYSLNVTAIEPQLPFLLGMSGIKRIISIGGWDFSTDPDTYMIFRDVVSSETNRATLITNVVNFLVDNDLDGVDWDWEYPDEPDIEGIPAGTAEDSVGYFLLLEELKTSLASSSATSDMTVSFTAPASFWYLQYFPVLALSYVVDYIVYMTYDLHGQWDYGHAYSDDGCSAGNCLRSHVNLTETINALSMITKAGVSANTVAVGVSSYGRSFEMTEAGCWTEMCTYTGPDSGALPGPCTDTAGYISDYELGLIIAENPTAESLFDSDSFSNILVYNDTQWVAYMNDSNKAVRTILYESLNFLGVADWAVDLQSDDGDGDSSSSSSNSSAETIYVNPDIWNSATPIVTALPGDTLIWPPMPLSSTTTITFPLWATTVSYSSLTTLTSTLTDGSTSTYPWYLYVSIPTIISIPPVTTTAIPVWGVSLPTGSAGGLIYLTSSVQPDTFTITVTPVMNGTTSIVGATTTTDPATTVVWGDYTYIRSIETDTVGGSTTIIGGTTMAPTGIVVTPNPYPTTVPTTHDTKLNPKTTSWTSGSPPSPTSSPGCTGCGIICILFCDSDCPFCPPGVLGSEGGSSGGSDSGDDDNSSTKTESESSSTSTEPLATYTVLYAEEVDDDFPATYAAAADLSALASSVSSAWNSDFPLSTTSSSSSSSGSGSGSDTTSTESTSSKTTSKTTATTASATATPSNIAAFLLFTEYAGDTWIFQWWVIDENTDSVTDVCDTSADIEASADTVGPNPDYPDSDIGPFESHGISGCQYTAGKKNTIGTMTCPGVDSITCEKDPQYNEDFECDGPVMVAVMRCLW